MKNHGKKLINELCNYLGQDLNHPMCKELMQHINECPECQFYLDTVKLTVSLYRKSHEPQSVPAHVKERLIKTLNVKRQKLNDLHC